ncbi:hypothetical protein [Bacillus bombysepticus]|uniref:hypothetical protein n=1 Tax=Bacillus bombysepticus TaxID=658666 RepID=UPI003018F5DA
MKVKFETNKDNFSSYLYERVVHRDGYAIFSDKERFYDVLVPFLIYDQNIDYSFRNDLESKVESFLHSKESHPESCKESKEYIFYLDAFCTFVVPLFPKGGKLSYESNKKKLEQYYCRSKPSNSVLNLSISTDKYEIKNYTEHMVIPNTGNEEDLLVYLSQYSSVNLILQEIDAQLSKESLEFLLDIYKERLILL